MIKEGGVYIRLDWGITGTKKGLYTWTIGY